MFEALLDRKIQERRTNGLLMGEIAAAIYNSSLSRKPDSKPWTALDFVPDLKREIEAERPTQPVDEMIAILSSVMGCGPGVAN